MHSLVGNRFRVLGVRDHLDRTQCLVDRHRVRQLCSCYGTECLLDYKFFLLRVVFNYSSGCVSSEITLSLFVLMTHMWPLFSSCASSASKGKSLSKGDVSSFNVRSRQSTSTACRFIPAW